MPSTTLPTVVTCTSLVVELLPLGMLNDAPLGQFTVMPAPVAVSVPVTPAVYADAQAASLHATMVSVEGLHVRPLPVPWRISRWCGPVEGDWHIGGIGVPLTQAAVQVDAEPQHTLFTAAPGISVITAPLADRTQLDIVLRAPRLMVPAVLVIVPFTCASASIWIAPLAPRFPVIFAPAPTVRAPVVLLAFTACEFAPTVTAPLAATVPVMVTKVPTVTASPVLAMFRALECPPTVTAPPVPMAPAMFV